MSVNDLHAIPLVVAIGGFDPSGGAGVVRDFLTARTWGAAVHLVPTAWTDQSVTGVRSIEPREPRALEAAIRGVLHDVGLKPGLSAPTVVKIGMVPDAQAAAAIESALSHFGGPVVFDPVLRASNGGPLFVGDVQVLLRLAVRATVVTPNALEASALTGRSVRTAAEAAVAAEDLCHRGAQSVLVKGGHLDGETAAIDLLVSRGNVRHFHAPRVAGPSVRGTGCALATAIAVGLGRGLPTDGAVAHAKSWLTEALGRAVVVGAERHLP